MQESNNEVYRGKVLNIRASEFGTDDGLKKGQNLDIKINMHEAIGIWINEEDEIAEDWIGKLVDVTVFERNDKGRIKRTFVSIKKVSDEKGTGAA